MKRHLRLLTEDPDSILVSITHPSKIPYIEGVAAGGGSLFSVDLDLEQ